MKAKLVLLSSKASGKEFELTLPVKIGRGEDVRLKLMHPLVSRKHCEIFEKGDALVVRDLSSLNGTFVDDERVADEMPLPSGSRLTVGSANFQVLYGKDYDRPSAAAPVVASDAPTKVADDTVRVAAPAKPEPAPAKAEPAPVKAAAAKAETKAGFDDLDDLWSMAQKDGGKAKPAAHANGDDEFDFTLADDPKPTVAATSKTLPAVKPAAAAAAAAKSAPQPVAGGKPAAAKPAAQPAKAAEPTNDKKSGGKSDDDDLDDFFNAIM
jgi:pSer/pThr/pTyr-binding forkhead associated (FHA) protein